MQEDWIIVEAPDGTEIEFPSTMSDDDIAGVMRQQYPPNDSAQKFLNVGNQMGMAMPSMDQFTQIRDASVARQQDMARTLDTMGRNVVERRRRHSRDPFRRSTERVDISLDGKDPAPAKNYTELGANELGVSQGLTFRLGDEIKGLIQGEQAGKDQRRLVNYAKRAEPNAFNEGELVGTGFNTLGTLPLAAPRSLQVARALPGGAKTKAFLTGLMSGAGWDTAFQMAGGDGSIADRFADTDKTQTATAAAIGGGAGWLISSIANPLSREASEFADVLDGVLDTRGAVTPDGLRSLERFLRNKGIALDDVTLGRIQTVIQDHAQTGAKSLSLPVRVKDVLVEALDGGSGQIRDAIKNQLRGTVGAGEEGATTIQNAVNEDYAASRQAIQDQYGKRLGQRSRIASEDKTLAELRRIGEEGYEPILERGATSYQGARDLDEVLKGPGINKLKSPLEEIAAGEGLSLEDMIQQNPLRAAHWMQSKARQLAESATDAVKSQAFSAFRRRLLNVIEEAAPGYDKIRKKYGDEFGNLQALEFGDKFLTNAGKAFEIDKMARAFKNLSAAQKRVALLSVRDVLRTATGKGKKAAPPRLTRVGEEQTLEALETVFGARGARVAQDIQDLEDYLDLRAQINVRKRNSQTANLIEDIQTAKRNVQPTWRRKIGGALENLAGDTALTAMGAGPIQSARATVGRAGQAIGGNMSGKMNAFAELLEAPIKRGQARVATQRKTTMKGPDGKFISNTKARELGLLDDEPQNAFNPTPSNRPVNPDEFFTESQKGSAVMAPDYPSNAVDDALQRMGTPESQLGQRVDDGIIGLRQTMNEAADQFEQMVASNPGQQSYVFSLPDDPRVGREAVERMLKYRDQMRWGPSKRTNTVLVMSADGGDLALVDRALTNRGGPFATTEATRGAGVNWYRLNNLADLDAIAGNVNNAATRGNGPIQNGMGILAGPELGGAVLGGAAGATQGETLEERGRNAFTGAVTGGLLGRGARGLRGRVAPQQGPRTYDHSIFKTSGGNEITFSLGKKVDANGNTTRLDVDFWTNGVETAIRPDAMARQSPQEVREIIDGLSQRLKAAISEQNPQRVVIDPTSRARSRLFERLVRQDTPEGYRAQTSGDTIILERVSGSDNGILGNQRGVMMIDGQPRRRQDVLREARQAGDGSFPRAQPQTPPQPPANAFAQRSGGLRESPLLPLLGIGAAGTGGVIAYDQMNRPQAVAPTGPPSNAFVQGIMRNANTALDDINMRREQGLPKTPGLKPDLTRTVEGTKKRANTDAVNAERDRWDDYRKFRRYRFGDSGEYAEYIRQINAHKFSGKTITSPKERGLGIRAKRIVYDYDTPMDELINQPIEVLVDGEWIPEDQFYQNQRQRSRVNAN